MKIRKYTSLFEAVQRPENYLEDIQDLLEKNKDKIFKSIKKQKIKELCIRLSVILKKYKIKVRFKDTIGDYFGISSDSYCFSDKYNSIYIFINNQALDTINSEKNYILFIDGLLQTIGHEIIHRLQNHNKVSIEIQKYINKKANKSEKDYRFSKQEIMSYAWNIIEEFRFSGYTDLDILNIMKSSDKNIKFTSNKLPNVYAYYIEFFTRAYDRKDLLNKLHKYMYEYIKG